MSKNTIKSDIAVLASQIGSVLLPDNDGWMNRFQVKSSSSSALYTIAQRRSDRVWGCSCPGWRHYRHCKHVTDVLSRLASVAATAAVAYNENVVAILASARTAYLDLEQAKSIKTPKARMIELDI